MRTATRTALGSAFLLALGLALGAAALAACGSDAPPAVTDDDAGQANTGTVDSGAPPPKQDASPPVDSGAPHPEAGGNHCVPNCTSDQDCQNSCPAVPKGVNCCDTATGVCFSAQTAQCPAPQPDSGSQPPAY